MAKIKKTERERLDPMSEILIATSAINYLAHLIFTVNERTKRFSQQMPDENKTLEEDIADRDETLKNAVKKLGEIMEELGNCANDYDMICRIDERVTDEPFKIILHRKNKID